MVSLGLMRVQWQILVRPFPFGIVFHVAINAIVFLGHL